MELTRGRGPFPTVMARVEVPSDIKQESERWTSGGLAPWKDFLATHFKIRETPFWIERFALF